MKIISADQVHAALSYPALIDALEQALRGRFSMPPRHVYPLDEGHSHNAFAILPSWDESLIGVKAFTYFPDNLQPHPSLHSKILLFDRAHGEPLALVDGTTVTFWRTAGVSGLATRLLARENAKSLLVVGTGNLCPYLVRANASVRPLEKLAIWGRTPPKAEAVAARMAEEFPALSVTAASDLEAACGDADIIVSATGSHEPLVLGDWVAQGTHTDFIGNHHATKRECDSALVTKAKVYADTRDNCFREAGEILVPISEGTFKKEDVVGDLREMCSRTVPLRENDDEITLFKSIGMALSDLVGAGLAYKVTTGGAPPA